VCILTGAFCDSIINCGWERPLGHIGYDEENCKKRALSTEEIYETFQTERTTTTDRPYIGINTQYFPPAKKGPLLSPLYIILIFLGVTVSIFGACMFLAKANEKKFNHTMHRFSTMTMRRSRRNQPSSPHSEHNTATNRRVFVLGIFKEYLCLILVIIGEFFKYDVFLFFRTPSAPPPSASEDEIQPPSYHHLFPSAPPDNV